MIKLFYLYLLIGVIVFIFKLISLSFTIKVLSEPDGDRLKKYVSEISDSTGMQYELVLEKLHFNVNYIKNNPTKYAIASIFFWPRFIFNLFV